MGASRRLCGERSRAQAAAAACADARCGPHVPDEPGRVVRGLTHSFSQFATQRHEMTAGGVWRVRMAHPSFLSEVSDENGVSPDRLSAALHITKSELAIASGLSRDAVAKAARRNSAATQLRLLEISEIIDWVIPHWRAGNALSLCVTARSRAAVRRCYCGGTGAPRARRKVGAYLGRIAAGGLADFGARSGI